MWRDSVEFGAGVDCDVAFFWIFQLLADVEFLAIDLHVIELEAKEVTLLDGVPFEFTDELTSVIVAKSNI